MFSTGKDQRADHCSEQTAARPEIACLGETVKLSSRLIPGVLTKRCIEQHGTVLDYVKLHQTTSVLHLTAWDYIELQQIKFNSVTCIAMHSGTIMHISEVGVKKNGKCRSTSLFRGVWGISPHGVQRPSPDQDCIRLQWTRTRVFANNKQCMVIVAILAML